MTKGCISNNFAACSIEFTIYCSRKYTTRSTVSLNHWCLQYYHCPGCASGIRTIQKSAGADGKRTVTTTAQEIGM